MRDISRRTFMVGSLGALLSGHAVAECLTPSQTAGPFYPEPFPAESDVDLTRLAGHAQSATGEVIVVHGRVLDPSGKPVPGATVEIWQANHFGRYDHPRDNNAAQLDPHFQGAARMTADADGEYRFTTIRPGAYSAGRSMRTPHIHFKIGGDGYRELTTQMYFAGHELNPRDGIYNRLDECEQERVTIRFQPRDPAPTGQFDILLARA